MLALLYDDVPPVGGQGDQEKGEEGLAQHLGEVRARVGAGRAPEEPEWAGYQENCDERVESEGPEDIGLGEADGGAGAAAGGAGSAGEAAEHTSG